MRDPEAVIRREVEAPDGAMFCALIGSVRFSEFSRLRGELLEAIDRWRVARYAQWRRLADEQGWDLNELLDSAAMKSARQGKDPPVESVAREALMMLRLPESAASREAAEERFEESLVRLGVCGHEGLTFEDGRTAPCLLENEAEGRRIVSEQTMELYRQNRLIGPLAEAVLARLMPSEQEKKPDRPFGCGPRIFQLSALRETTGAFAA